MWVSTTSTLRGRSGYDSGRLGNAILSSVAGKR
jgi:hypothetical protein